MKKRVFTLLATTLLALGMMAVPAAAHVLVVDPPGQEEPVAGWVGGPTLPEQAQGQGLMPNPFGLQPPSHAKGLNAACEALRTNGNGVVDMWGPPSPYTCQHGEPAPS